MSNRIKEVFKITGISVAAFENQRFHHAHVEFPLDPASGIGHTSVKYGLTQQIYEDAAASYPHEIEQHKLFVVEIQKIASGAQKVKEVIVSLTPYKDQSAIPQQGKSA